MFKKILIANRGEIACRIIRTCKRMGISTVAVYSEADTHSLHALSADERVAIGPAEAKLSYLDIQRIIDAAKATGAEAIHPGYGFLAENPAFARAVSAAQIKLIGPSAEVIELMGDKLRAKELATSVGVPIVPGFTIEGASSKPEQSDLKKLKALLNKIGYPILIKAAAGGGGRGMRKIYSEAELAEGIDGAAREALAFFKDDRLFIEKLVENARHIEVQFFGDSLGNVFHLFDRDCSMQRRHQKVIEEAPAPEIHHTVREQIRQAALAIAKTTKYTNAGTAEFLLDRGGNFYFLEINSRLQVEHPVTEMVTGLDIVELQLRAANGENLQEFVAHSGLTTGHGVAIEARICAEVPEDNFTAAAGTFSLIEFGSTTRANSGLKYNVRVDSGYATGDTVSHYYDSLIAKVIVHAENRIDAIEGLRDVLRHSSIFGVKSNVGFLLRLTRSQEFINATHHIALAERLVPDQQEQCRVDGIVTGLGLIARLLRNTETGHSAWKERLCWRHGGHGKIKASFLTNGRPVSIVLVPISTTELEIYPISCTLETEPVHITHMRIDDEGVLRYRRKGREEDLHYLKTALDTIWIQSRWGCFEVRDAWPQLKHRSDERDSHSGEIVAPFPGKIVGIKAEVGTRVELGEPIIVIESMKMEHQLKAPLSGEIAMLGVKEGDVVESKRLLAKIA